LREAAAKLRSWRLDECSIAVTLEPCPMCAGALVNARIRRLVYGATDPKMGCVGTLYNLCVEPRFNHRLEVQGDMLAEECGALLSGFFAKLRASRQ
jgi:tRNA(adenine34) deaminase